MRENPISGLAFREFPIMMGCLSFPVIPPGEVPHRRESMKSRFWSSIQRLVTVALLATCCSALVYAQSTTDGAIGGTVYDSTGAVVANAKVTVHNNGTNAEPTIVSDASGSYRVTGLQSGSYTVSISGSGLAPDKPGHVSGWSGRAAA